MLMRNWRAALLLVLLTGPILVYMGLGALWLREHGWLLYATLIWIGLGVLFGLLADRWTRRREPVLPPIDWDLPQTFTPRDRRAWEIVQHEAGRVDSLPGEALSNTDTYIEAGKRLNQVLAIHYHPDSAEPLDQVPVVEFLSALELAAEDLVGLCRQVPGGDLITASHWKRAVQVSGLVSRANDIYSYVMPLVQPVSGLVRLGTQQFMVKPAWRNMQVNLMRWFWQAYVNRLGMHLIELHSGRLAIGADMYRRLTRRGKRAQALVGESAEPLTAAIVGVQGVPREKLQELLDESRSGDLTRVRARLIAAGLDGTLAERLRDLNWVDVPEYSHFEAPSSQTSRDRSSRAVALSAAADVDLLVLVVDGTRASHADDAAFAHDWETWFTAHPMREQPPVLVVMTGADKPDWGGPWTPPYDWSHPRRPRELAVRAAVDALRKQLPESFPEPVAVGLDGVPPFGVSELILPALATLLHRAERVGLIRRLQEVHGRSTARRLLDQGQQLWKTWRGTASAKKG
jgi:hypothetical protein